MKKKNIPIQIGNGKIRMITPRIVEIAKKHDPNVWIGQETLFFQTTEQAKAAWKEIQPLVYRSDFQSLNNIYIFDRSA